MYVDRGKAPAVMERVIRANSAWLATTRVGSQVLAVAFTVLVARGGGVVVLGQYAFLAGALLVANTITTFGTDTVLIRRASASADSSLPSAAMVLQIALSLLCIGVTWWTLPAFGLTQELLNATRVVMLALFPLAAYSVFTAVLRSHNRMDAYMGIVLATSIAQAGGGALLLLRGISILGLATLLLVVNSFSAGAAYMTCLKVLPGFRLSLKLRLSDVIGLTREAFGLGIVAGMTLTYQRLGIFLLTLLAGEMAAGYFSASLRIAESLKLIPNSVSGAMLPVLGGAFALGETATGQRAALAFRKTWQRLLVLSAVLAGGVCLLAGPIVGLLYGASYSPSVQALRLMGLALIPFTFNASQSLKWISLGKASVVIAPLGAGMVVLVGVSLLLLPHAGLLGVCIASLAAESLQAFVYLARDRLSPALHARDELSVAPIGGDAI